MFKIITFFMITLFLGLTFYVFVLLSYLFWLLYYLSFVLRFLFTPLMSSSLSLYKSNNTNDFSF